MYIWTSFSWFTASCQRHSALESAFQGGREENDQWIDTREKEEENIFF